MYIIDKKRIIKKRYENVISLKYFMQVKLMKTVFHSTLMLQIQENISNSFKLEPNFRLFALKISPEVNGLLITERKAKYQH